MSTSSARLPIALIGTGDVGRMHIGRALRSDGVVVAAVADPDPSAAELGPTLGVPHFADAQALLERVAVRAAIVATPNQAHAEAAIACVERGVPVLVEKPIADTLENARTLGDAADAAGVPLLDTAALLLRFANGALGTVSVSDTAVAPWNWDLAAGEAAHYPQQDVDSHFLSGTEGSLTLAVHEAARRGGAVTLSAD